jgi:hypothetical protein
MKDAGDVQEGACVDKDGLREDQPRGLLLASGADVLHIGTAGSTAANDASPKIMAPTGDSSKGVNTRSGLFKFCLNTNSSLSFLRI